MNEQDFLEAILDTPADDALRLVYADWLEERGDEESSRKSWYLRITAEIPPGAPPHRWPPAQFVELRVLAARLATDWLAVVSRLPIEICPKVIRTEARRGAVIQECPERQWDQLERSSDVRFRHCDACQGVVRYCETMIQARDHAPRGPVAMDLAIRRTAGDLRAIRSGELLDEPDSSLARLRRLIELERDLRIEFRESEEGEREGDR